MSKRLASGCLQVLDTRDPHCDSTQASPPFWSKKAAKRIQLLGSSLLVFRDPTAETRQAVAPLRPGRKEDAGGGVGM